MADGSLIFDTKIDSNGIKTGLAAMGKVVASGVAASVASIGGLGTAAIKAGSDFESAFAGVKKTVDASDEQLTQLRDDILNMSKAMPIAANEIAGVAEAAGQLGIKTENISSFTKTMADLGVATNMTSEQAATSLARLANITGMSQQDFDKLGSTIVALGNNLATTESEIVDMSLRLAGAGKQVGLSEAQILGLSGALSSVGMQAELGGSAFSRVLSMMQLAVEQGGEALDQFAKTSGMTADQFKQAFEEDATKALMAFINGLGQAESSGKSAIAVIAEMGECSELSALDTIGIRDALLRAAGASDVFADALNIGTEAWEENTALVKEAEQRYETFESQLQIMKNTATDLGIAVYEEIKEPLRDVVEYGTEAIKTLSEAFERGGLEGLISEVGKSFANLAADIAKQAPKMIDAATDLIKGFVDGIKKQAPKLKQAALDIATALAEGLTKLLPQKLQKPIKTAINDIKKSFTDGGLKQAIKTVSNIISDLGDVIAEIARVALPIFTKAIDLVGGSLKVVIPLITAAVVGWKTWQIVQQVSTWMQSAATAITAMTTATTAQTAASAASAAAATAETAATTAATGAITLKQIAVGLATKAQLLWNAAMSANPIGLVITAVAALAAGIALLCSTLNDGMTAQEKWNESNLALGESFAQINQKTIDFTNGISSAKNIMDGFDETITVSSEKQQELATQMQSTQNEITTIAETATAERRNLTQSEIQRLDELFQKMQELTAKELEMQAVQQEVVTERAQLLADTHAGTLEEYAAYSQDYINSAEQTRDKVIELANTQLNEELALIKQKHEAAGTLNTQAYTDEVAAAQKKYEDNISIANAECAQTISILRQGYEDRANTLIDGNNNLAQIEKEREKSNQAHQEAMEKIEQEHQEELSKITSTGQIKIELEGQAIRDKQRKVEEEQARWMEEQARINQRELEIIGNETYQEQSATWLAMIGEQELYGGQVTGKTREMADTMLGVFEGLPSEAQQAFKDVGDGMIKGLEEKEPSLFAKASNIASSVLGRIKKIFQIASPSKAMKKIFSQLIQGGEVGTDQEKPKLLRKTDSLANNIINRFGGMARSIDFKGLYQKAANAVDSMSIGWHNKASSGLPASYHYSSDDNIASTTAKHPDPRYIENNIYIDGKKTARIITPYVSKQLEWEGK